MLETGNSAMKQLTGLAVIVLAAFPASAMAQASDTATGTVAIDGRVAPICILGDPTPALVNLGQMAVTSGTRVGKIAVLPAQVVNLPASFCNFAGSRITVTATALTSSDASSPQPGFARAVNYTATAAGWAAGNAVVTTAALGNGAAPTATGNGATQPLPKIADIGFTLSSFTVPGDLIMVAGNYSGQVVVTLGPVSIGD
jgi:hypothetical protein